MLSPTCFQCFEDKENIDPFTGYLSPTCFTALKRSHTAKRKISGQPSKRLETFGTDSLACSRQPLQDITQLLYPTAHTTHNEIYTTDTNATSNRTKARPSKRRQRTQPSLGEGEEATTTTSHAKTVPTYLAPRKQPKREKKEILSSLSSLR
jgi:hypothetical protein